MTFWLLTEMARKIARYGDQRLRVFRVCGCSSSACCCDSKGSKKEGRERLSTIFGAKINNCA